MTVKHAKFGVNLDNFRFWPRMLPEQIRERHNRQLCLSHLAGRVQ